MEQKDFFQKLSDEKRRIKYNFQKAAELYASPRFPEEVRTEDAMSFSFEPTPYDYFTWSNEHLREIKKLLYGAGYWTELKDAGRKAHSRSGVIKKYGVPEESLYLAELKINGCLALCAESGAAAAFSRYISALGAAEEILFRNHETPMQPRVGSVSSSPAALHSAPKVRNFQRAEDNILIDWLQVPDILSPEGEKVDSLQIAQMALPVYMAVSSKSSERSKKKDLANRRIPRIKAFLNSNGVKYDEYEGGPPAASYILFKPEYTRRY